MNAIASSAEPAEQREDRRAAPAVVVPAQEPQDHQEQRSREGHQAGDVQALGIRIADVDHLEGGQRDRGDTDRHVHEEDPPPAQSVGEKAADQWSGGHRRADGRPPRGDRASAIGALVGLPDQRQAGGEHRTTAQTLERTRPDQDARRRCQPARKRRRGEHHHADDEHPLSSVPVRQRTAGQNHAGQRQRIRIDHPLEIGKARVQIPLDRRQRHLHHGHVDEQHERRCAQRNQRPPSPPAGVSRAHDCTVAITTRHGRRLRSVLAGPSCCSTRGGRR